MPENRKLLLTGASSDVAKELLKKIGCNYSHIIAIYNHSSDNIQELQSLFGDKVLPQKVDLSNLEEIDALMKRLKEDDLLPDHLIHLAAGKIHNVKFEKECLGNFEDSINVSLRSIIKILLMSIPHMKKQKYGKIVFMLTSGVLNMPPKYQSAYVVPKYALLGLMRELSIEYAGKGITVNAVSPDMMETKFLSEVPDLIIQANAANSPAGRNIMISEVVPAFEYLLSDGADAVTGVNIPVTGGKV
ncbi:SDR family NAD(P)-dependent oxidoreductase [Butyrivibrio hungatei]|uniref:Short chain dehydrogenase/reductase n=1 Tax=Butyrivibrio hungatei TaxID=185008 RepID=A0A1D9NZ98_9FIRM|nr:SDR family oxidoreductase [Butyrivibrio hungatei]AOZ95494.1 short chain dehydrogenase/reductase [Butyrivibrio hungatei]